jgi:hypothetical protein
MQNHISDIIEIEVNIITLSSIIDLNIITKTI